MTEVIEYVVRNVPDFGRDGDLPEGAAVPECFSPDGGQGFGEDDFLEFGAFVEGAVANSLQRTGKFQRLDSLEIGAPVPANLYHSLLENEGRDGVGVVEAREESLKTSYPRFR